MRLKRRRRRTVTSNNGPILLFDGVCNLCNAAVRFVIARDKQHQFRFASLQSQAARQALLKAGAPTDLPDSVVVIDRLGVHTRSDAALRIASILGRPWSFVAGARVLPRFLRDWVYRGVARHRYRVFGRRETCLAPTPALRERFLDAEEYPLGAATLTPDESRL
ncbi:MAG: thiol-disulfide oxidoreductase DCC family protein [Candidatus Eisenbacteria bacterium]|uniref:Thiol-disulfide oxidoreductase DCC family protein n=1 Tax=Eiseniibacteriota bacterium TaxID=2212470 RepID=A0A7Y2EBP6_UNCEI|nr:thiol-disulfide oxidoreductase DCC family protein [Candidatus Eisenbacteria bacterium]